MKLKFFYGGLLVVLLLSYGTHLWAQDTIYLPIIVSASAGSGTAPTATATPNAAATATPTATATGVSPTATPTLTATPPSTTDATTAIVTAANAFLATLSSTEQEAVRFDWTDTAQKQRWSNFPQGLFTRDGLMWGNLSTTQQNAWLAVMQATLSTDGYNRVLAEWQADDELVGGGGCCYGIQYYWIAIIGTPSTTEPWQWQWGGHHVTVNATISGSAIALTPSFIGVQPASYTDGSGNTVRPLGDIDDEAFALVNALDATQQGTAILGNTAIDLVLGPGEDGRTIAAEGLPASQMTTAQRTAFLHLIGHYAGLANDEDAAVLMAEIEATLDDTYFAWYGSTTQGQAAYFRVTGPEVIIEYATQSMGGNPANHIHGVYRHPTNDYGAEITQ